jgi:methionine-rich copper-binding protein CopC
MTRPSPFGNRWLRRALALVVTVSALVVGAATAAEAHNVLVGTSPANGSMTAVVPAQVTLTFNEPAIAVGTILIVTGPAGQVQTGAPVLVNNTVTQKLRPGSPAGSYSVSWRVTSTDGHPVSGRFLFTAMAPSKGQQATATASAPSGPATVSGQASGIWWVVTAGAVLLLLLLLAAFIVTRKPDTTPPDEWDPDS